MRDKTFMKWMRLLPKSALSTVVGMATRAPVPRPVHHLAMRAFAQRYGVALEEAEHELEGYSSFAQFFTRRLKPGARPIEGGENVVVSPVDGTVYQVGYVTAGECLQAKGIGYSLRDLLQDEARAARFAEGAVATLYLSPRDYHRVHAPIAGRVEGFTYIPGEFWPVNPQSARTVQRLFCLNERLITHLATAYGSCAVVQVGATCVARIRASYDNVLTHSGQPAASRRYDVPILIAKGDELGVFEMGSTVILLFQKGRVRWDASLAPGAPVRMGQRIGEAT